MKQRQKLGKGAANDGLRIAQDRGLSRTRGRESAEKIGTLQVRWVLGNLWFAPAMTPEGITTLETRFCQAIGTIVPLLLGLTLLTGCISKVALTKPIRESMRSVSIKKDVRLLDDIYYYGQEQCAGAAFGLLGAVATLEAAKEPKTRLKAAMQESQIDLGQIIGEQFATELVEANIFPSIVPEGGDAEVRLEVLMFGFTLPTCFSGKLKPVVGVMGSLVGKDGTVIWQKLENVSGLNGQTPGNTLDEYLQNPKFIREAFSIAGKIVSDGLVKHMQKD